MLPTNGPNLEGLFVILKSYFDGGNQADSREYDVISLAVGSGSSDEWTPFERDWREMLIRHHAGYLHTTDAVARVNQYAGWTEDKADSFLRDCARIVEKHFIRLNTEYGPGQFGLYCFVVSINLQDFVKHCEANPEASKNANEGCFRQAIGDVLLWSQDQAAACEEIHCFFDQGEPFYGYLVNLMNSKQAKKDAWLLNKITSRTEANSRQVPALQFADLFAWVESHRDEPWNPDWKKRILRLPYWRERIDVNNLHDVNLAHRAAWNTWNIPKRAATK
jgi:hypothetical protein